MIAVNFDKREYLNIDEDKEPFYMNKYGVTSLEELIYLIAHDWKNNRVFILSKEFKENPFSAFITSSLREEFSDNTYGSLYNYVIETFDYIEHAPVMKCPKYICNEVLKLCFKIKKDSDFPLFYFIFLGNVPNKASAWASSWTDVTDGVFFSDTAPEGFSH